MFEGGAVPLSAGVHVKSEIFPGGHDMKICHHCKKAVEIAEKVGRADTCPVCDADLHCCLNCRFYDPGAYNECRETQAERVLDKDWSQLENH